MSPSSPPIWRLGLDILADMAQNSLMTAEMIEKERKVLLEEISLANIYPPSYVLNLVSKTLFPQNALALPISGTKDSVQAIRRDDLLNFYKLHYSPERAFITIVGNINPRKAQAAVRAHFSSWTARNEPLSPASPPLRQNRSPGSPGKEIPGSGHRGPGLTGHGPP